jgi:hypothetical protein
MTLPPKQKIVRFGPDYKLSIVDEINHKDKFELAVFYKGNMVEMPGITNPGDTVTRFKTASDVQMIMKKMYSITGEVPENNL